MLVDNIYEKTEQFLQNPVDHFNIFEFPPECLTNLETYKSYYTDLILQVCPDKFSHDPELKAHFEKVTKKLKECSDLFIEYFENKRWILAIIINNCDGFIRLFPKFSCDKITLYQTFLSKLPDIIQNFDDFQKVLSCVQNGIQDDVDQNFLKKIASRATNWIDNVFDIRKLPLEIPGLFEALKEPFFEIIFNNKESFKQFFSNLPSEQFKVIGPQFRNLFIKSLSKLLINLGREDLLLEDSALSTKNIMDVFLEVSQLDFQALDDAFFSEETRDYSFISQQLIDIYTKSLPSFEFFCKFLSTFSESSVEKILFILEPQLKLLSDSQLQNILKELPEIYHDRVLIFCQSKKQEELASIKEDLILQESIQRNSIIAEATLQQIMLKELTHRELIVKTWEDDERIFVKSQECVIRNSIVAEEVKSRNLELEEFKRQEILTEESTEFNKLGSHHQAVISVFNNTKFLESEKFLRKALVEESNVVYKDAANTLITCLDKAKKQFAEDGLLDALQKKYQDAIQNARPVLSQHQGWRRILQILSDVISSIVARLPFSEKINNLGLFSMPKTHEGRLLDSFENNVNSLSIA